MLNLRVDEYIAKAQPFAKPILEKIRSLVHQAYPLVEEKIKWGFPHFDVAGEMMCSMAAFKQHCSFGFWKASLLDDPNNLFLERGEGMGHFGKMQSLNDLPSDDIFLDYIHRAIQLNLDGIKVKKTAQKSIPAAEVVAPDDLIRALEAVPAAMHHFETFSNSHRKEYIVWINDAKTEKTRLSRIEKAVAQLSEGKSQNWKYQQKKA